MADFNSVAKEFVEFYYKTFDASRAQLAGLYREQSMLTFESTSTLGTAAIVEKLANLPFQKVQHQVSTLDAQPSVNEGIFILITGALLVDEEARPMNFSQAFQLMKDANGQYFVFNDVFKLIFG